MNNGKLDGLFARILYRAFLSTRYLFPSSATSAISAQRRNDAIGRIYVINLDRHDERWRGMRRELRRVRDRSGKPITQIARRFSAVDAKYYNGTPSAEVVQTAYSLADQLFVDPHPLPKSENAHNSRVQMTQQEVAVALSHIGVWKEISRGPRGYTLVLEDDVYFRRGFARSLDRAWVDVSSQRDSAPTDIIYLSYKEAQAGAAKHSVSRFLFEPARGLWFLSGYVLSRRGARKLLRHLPVRGPIDLWMNHQFADLDVFATTEPLIKQRRDLDSSNEYSILPILSKVGIITEEKPLLFDPPDLPTPVIGVGEGGSGLTSLSMALSMLGYRCCSDVSSLPVEERSRLFRNEKRVFDAYVNVASLDSADCLELARVYPGARFIITNTRSTIANELADTLEEDSGSVLVLSNGHQDKWALLSRFLGCDYPSHPYPECRERSPREVKIQISDADDSRTSHPARVLERDPSPWTIDRRDWRGIRCTEVDGAKPCYTITHGEPNDRRELDPQFWTLRDDTFPSNLALYRPSNISIDEDGVTRLQLREESTPVRGLTAACICSRDRYLYGKFGADVRPPAVSGVITGIFLHRNRPRQEIDIEFLGARPTKMLINVFYNPGGEGAKLEYGYRGTPVLIDLGFDASAEFHRYEIEWNESSIRWWVDGELAHERVCWNPTPIPHLPMQLNANIWHSRSEELAGPLSRKDLPVVAEFKRLQVRTRRVQEVSSRWPAHST